MAHRGAVGQGRGRERNEAGGGIVGTAVAVHRGQGQGNRQLDGGLYRGSCGRAVIHGFGNVGNRAARNRCSRATQRHAQVGQRRYAGRHAGGVVSRYGVGGAAAREGGSLVRPLGRRREADDVGQRYARRDGGYGRKGYQARGGVVGAIAERYPGKARGQLHRGGAVGSGGRSVVGEDGRVGHRRTDGDRRWPQQDSGEVSHGQYRYLGRGHVVGGHRVGGNGRAVGRRANEGRS